MGARRICETDIKEGRILIVNSKLFKCDLSILGMRKQFCFQKLCYKHASQDVANDNPFPFSSFSGDSEMETRRVNGKLKMCLAS